MAETWTRICCAAYRRRIEQGVATGGAAPEAGLARHLARCASCEAYRNGLAATVAALPARAELPWSEEGFEAGVWARIDAAARPARRPATRPAVPPAAAVCGVALAVVVLLVWWRGVPIDRGHDPQRLAAKPAGISPNPSNPEAGPKRKPPTQMARATVTKPDTPREPSGGARRDQPKRQRDRTHRRSTLSPTRPVQIAHRAPVETPAQTARRFALAGRMFEAGGDDARACAAYRIAYAQEPDPDLGLAAGRTAERTEDLSSALAYYADVLTRTAPRPEGPEKEDRPWTDEPAAPSSSPESPD
jgi:hypothetical protein